MSEMQKLLNGLDFFRTGRFLSTAPVLIFIVLGLTGCPPNGSPTLSLQEAKTATLSFPRQSFTPPPKTIVDITALLDAHPLTNPSAVEKSRAEARQPPPASTSKSARAKFYLERAKSAKNVGNVRQEIAALSEAARLVRAGADPGGSGFVGSGTTPNSSRRDAASAILLRLSLAELSYGKYLDSIRHRREALAQDPFGHGLHRGMTSIPSWAFMVIHGVTIGDLEFAEKTLAKVESLLNEARSYGIKWDTFGDWYTVFVQRAKASFLDAKGQHEAAERLYRSAIALTRKYTENSDNRDEIGVGNTGLFMHRALAINLMRQGRLVEAEIEARLALEGVLSRVGRYTADTAFVLQVLVRVFNAQGRFAEAATLAAASVDIYHKAGAPERSMRLLQSRSLYADTLCAQEKWGEAADEFEEIEAALARDRKLFQQFFGGNVNRPLAFLNSGRTANAVSMARRVFERKRAILGDKNYDTAEALGILARALAATGDYRGAFRAFRQAVPIVLKRSNDDNSLVQHDWRLRQILEAYINVLVQIRGTGQEAEAKIDAAGEAFRIANVARSRSVQRALTASSARAAANNAELADLARREQDASKQIKALYGLLVNAMSIPPKQKIYAQISTDLRTRIKTLHGARATLTTEIRRRFPTYDALMNPKPATVAVAQQALWSGEALITTYVGETSSYVWAVPKTGKVVFTAVPLGKKRIAALIHSLRRALDPKAATLGDIPEFNTAISYNLYEALLGPVEAGWKDAKSLLVVAHGALGQLPFSGLVTRPGKLAPEKVPLFSNYRNIAFLVRSHGVTLLPSVSALKTLRSLPGASPIRRGFVGFADPIFGETRETAVPSTIKNAALARRNLMMVRGLPVNLRTAPNLGSVPSANLAKLPRLPDTADEVLGIALALNADLTRDVFLRKDASEDRVKSMKLSGYKVLAFATHGLVPGDLNGLIQPALALSSPKLTGGKEDGLLTMGEILGLKLDADWVVLSACNTASGSGVGAEAISGLGRAFFYAGTRALLVSNWPVETTSARALTTDIFRRQAKELTLNRSEALRLSMLELIDRGGLKGAEGRTVFSYAHPIFWASFSLIGNGGGGRPAG